MRILLAFIKKEILEQVRTGKVIILGLLFVLFGIMNPAMAKLTPWLLEVMSESLSDTGMTVTAVTVNSLASWTQFFKNIPVALAVFIFMQSASFTKEFHSGTLVLVLTKGVARHTVVTAKALVLFLGWSLGYWLCAAVTGAYTVYFWQDDSTHNLLFALFAWWLFGLMVIAACVFFSALCKENAGVTIGAFAVWFGQYVFSFSTKLFASLPIALAEPSALLVGQKNATDCLVALLSGTLLFFAFWTLSYPFMNKKQL